MGLGFKVLGLGFEVLVLRFEVLGLGFEVLGLGFEVLVLGFEVLGLGFKVSGLRCEFLVLEPLLGFTVSLQNLEPQAHLRQNCQNPCPKPRTPTRITPRGPWGRPFGVRGFGGPRLEKRSGFEVRKPGFEDLAGGAAKVPSGRGVGGRVNPPPFKKVLTLRPMVDGFHARKSKKWAASPTILGGSGHEIRGVADHFG